MKFWDSSAIVPLLVRERTTAGTDALRRGDPEMAVWWTTEVECESAIARREREGALARRDAVAARRRLDALGAAWREVAPSTAIRHVARRLLRVHPLRAADALQLAAALALAEGEPSSLTFVCLDDRLVACAEREGLAVEGPPAS